MQGSLSLPQRLSLQSIAALQSYKTFGGRSVGCCSFPHWQAFEKARANNGVAHVLPLLESVTAKGLAFGGNTEHTNMRGTAFASTPSCSYKTEVTPSGFNWTIATSGKSYGSLQKSCGIPKPVQHHAALQWLSLHTQRDYPRKPVVRVAGKSGVQEAVVKEEEFEFKRVVSEGDSITTFYSSDASSSSDDEEDEKKTKAPQAYAEDLDGESHDGEKGKDHKKVKKVKSLSKSQDTIEKTESSANFDIGCAEVQEKALMKKGEIVEKGKDSDSESEDEKQEVSTKEEKKIAKAELKLKEKLEKVRLKALKKEEKEQKKEAKKLDCEGKKDEESDSDRESDKEGKQISSEKTQTLTKSQLDKDLASDSAYEEEDDGVVDFGDDDLEEGTFEITEDEIENYVDESGISNEIKEALDEIDEDDEFWDDDEGDVVAGDGGTGGGVVVGETEWGKKALDVATQVVAECGKDLSIFAFKASSDRVIRVRLDKLTDRYGSPTLKDIENFSRKFSAILEESGEAGTMPKDIDVEVSSPGAERVVRVPDDLERFKELPMYVQYLEGETDQDGVFELESVDRDASLSVWKIANVKLNREVKGRGRPLNNKQKKWRATLPFASLKQVRLYLDV
ncbi:unnamed protein product [Calypogeia fissa]